MALQGRTAILTPQEVDTLLKALVELKSQGKTIILISHKLKEVIRICDKQKYCRMTTIELYKTIGAILYNPTSIKLRESLKKKIIACENEFKFDV